MNTEQAKTVLQTFSFFVKILLAKFKICASGFSTTTLAQNVIGNPQFSNELIIAIWYVNTTKYFILPGCSSKVSEKPSKFTFSVRVAIVPRSQQLRGHDSLQSMTTGTSS